jgi:hypothetical protein
MQALHSPFQDATNAQVASVPAIKSPPSKCRKLRKRSEIIEAGLIQSLAKVAEEVTAMREALGKIKEDLGKHNMIIRAIHEVIQIDEM